MRNRSARHRLARPWLALAGLLLALLVVLPPVGSAARTYVFVQALQFAVLATVTPALLVIGAPWRLASARVVDRLAIARSHRTGALRAWIVLIGFTAIAMAWRLPVAVNALAWHPVLTVAEAATLVPAGCALWLDLVDSPPFLPRIGRPLRAAFAALPMWTIWASAYIMGFSQTAWFTAFAHRPGAGISHGLGIISDQQLAAALLWAIPGACFVPLVYFSLLTWLRDTSDPDHELKRVPVGSDAAKSGMPRPPRGWRAPPA